VKFQEGWGRIDLCKLCDLIFQGSASGGQWTGHNWSGGQVHAQAQGVVYVYAVESTCNRCEDGKVILSPSFFPSARGHSLLLDAFLGDM
jgi:hypothetical protein